MNFLFFFFFLGAFLGLTSASDWTAEEKQRFERCMKKCLANKVFAKHKQICEKRCMCFVFHQCH
ncbi:unnamed protein product [Cylicocyclus nassatus]|uniref:Uncharacterized protein n=1 Tax=Cylicocyclus nassatus TaxID=53992 RepID=A0AA36H0T4_CYLNA|nr:unnamed protein product [Cylicocyclus nassatus]